MTTNDRFDRTLPAWLRDDAAHRVTDHLDEVLRVTATTRQRPAWSSLERWLPVDTTLRPRLFNLPSLGRLVLVAAVALALVGLLIFAVGSRQQRLPPPFGLARNGALVSSGDGDIYAIDPATGTRRVLIGGDRFDFGGTYSRDGTKMLFLRSATGCGTSDCGLILAVANADGTGVRELTPGLPGLDWSDWSADGTQIVIISTAPTGQGHLMSVVDVSTGTMRTLDVKRSVHEVSWLPPDGKWMVFRGEHLSASDPLAGIFAVRPDGTGLHEISTRPAIDANDYEGIAVSPDGQYVAYQDTDFADNPPWGLFRVHVLSLRTGEDRVLPKPARTAQMGGVFSPDGTRIAFVRILSDGNVQMVVAPTDGSGTGVGIGPSVRFTPGTDNINNYSWSPDGTAVLANYDSDKTARLLPIDGSTPTTLVQGEAALPGYQRLAP